MRGHYSARSGPMREHPLPPRYLVEAATGLFTGSVFNDEMIQAAGHYGETVDFRDGTTLLQKTHHRRYIQHSHCYYIN